MKRYVWTFGAIAGGIIAVYTLIIAFVLIDFSNMTPSQLQTAEVLGYARYLVLFVGVLMAMLAYRRRNAGPIPYKRVLLIGIGVAAVTGIFVGVMEFVYMLVNPDFYDQYGKIAEQMMRESGEATPENLEKFREQYESFSWMRNPAATGAFYFLETLALGTVFALIAALFTRRPESDGSNVAPVTAG
jgi:hypothetical protein